MSIVLRCIITADSVARTTANEIGSIIESNPEVVIKNGKKPDFIKEPSWHWGNQINKWIARQYKKALKTGENLTSYLKGFQKLVDTPNNKPIIKCLIDYRMCSVTSVAPTYKGSKKRALDVYTFDVATKFLQDFGININDIEMVSISTFDITPDLDDSERKEFRNNSKNNMNKPLFPIK